ncbi:MAG: 30S ribosomal protein S6--L-glutamate ligase [Gemmatimonadota bacterium]
MRIGILSRRPQLYSTRRLREAAEARGHEVRVVDYLRSTMTIQAQGPAIFLDGEPLEFDAVIPRIGASRTFYGTAVVRQFEMMGVFSVSESQAIVRSRDKLRAHQILARSGIDLPVTGFAHFTRDSQALIDAVGGPPLIIKLLEGTQGMGVVLAETRKAAESVIGAFRQLDANFLIQEFIKEAKGSDIRILVVGTRVAAAMIRHAAPGEFRSNLHRGGRAEAVKLSVAERRMALKAARAVGLGVAGVDLLRSARGAMVIEVNSSPGLQGIEEASKVDVAGKIIEYIEKNAVAVPRQRPRKVKG